MTEHFNLCVGMELAVPDDEGGPICVVDKIWLYKNYNTAPSGTRVTVGMKVLRPERMAQIAEAWIKGRESHVLFSGRPSIIVVDKIMKYFGDFSADHGATPRVKMILSVYPDNQVEPVKHPIPRIGMDDIIEAEIL